MFCCAGLLFVRSSTCWWSPAQLITSRCSTDLPQRPPVGPLRSPDQPLICIPPQHLGSINNNPTNEAPSPSYNTALHHLPLSVVLHNNHKIPISARKPKNCSRYSSLSRFTFRRPLPNPSRADASSTRSFR